MRWLASLTPIAFLTSCGYVGPVQPPSPAIPNTIVDLSVTERGNKIIATFTAPPRTTDGVAITRFSHIDLRVGSENQSPNSERSFEVEVPFPSDREDPQPKPMAYSFDVSDWNGKRIAVLVRTAIKKEGHFSSWSNKAVLDVVSPLETPRVTAEASANGPVLTWPASNATQFQVQRLGPSDKQPIKLASVNESRYVDISAGYDTEYRYIVTAKKDLAESLPSEPVVFSFTDKYPPAVPAGVTALVSPDSIDLAWQRNTEPDLQGYFIYRSTNNGPYQRMAELVALPTYTDRAVEHGKMYSYKISAIDKKNNESAQSSAVESQF